MPGSIQTKLCHQFTLADGTVCAIRNFSLGDIPEVLHVERQANPYPWTETNFLDSVNSSHICVAVEQGGQIVGQAVFSIASGDAELLILAVLPSWQGKGVARGILNYMFMELEDYVAEIFLEVRASNERAIVLYEGLGFNSVGTRPNYYPLGKKREDAVIYARSLRIA